MFDVREIKVQVGQLVCQEVRLFAGMNERGHGGLIKIVSYIGKQFVYAAYTITIQM